jgi:hypothetical protein
VGVNVFAADAPLPSGTHVFSLRIAQTSGPDAGDLTEESHDFFLSGPFVAG